MCEGMRLVSDLTEVLYRGGLSCLTFLPYFSCLLSWCHYFWLQKQEHPKGDSGLVYGSVESTAEEMISEEAGGDPFLPPLQGKRGGELGRREQICQDMATSAPFLKGVLISYKTLLGLTTVT